MRALKVASLFLGFGLIGLSGDYVVGMLVPGRGEDRVRVHVDPVVEVDVDVRQPDFDFAFDMQVDENGPCAYEAQRTASLATSATNLLRLSAGSGELSLHGREGLDRVQVVARACASSEGDLDDLQISLEQTGGDIVLSAHYPERSGSRVQFGESYARLDLVVEVPLAMAAEIDDGSGGMEVFGTGSLRIRDSSGEILVSDVLGGVDIDDGSGEIEVRSVAGPLTIHDSSGEIEVADGIGDVQIDDGSGEIDVRNVQGNLRLSDSSGGIDATQIDGSVTIEDDGSGEIDVADVSGDFSVLGDGSGSIRHSGVGGSVDIPVRKRDRRGS